MKSCIDTRLQSRVLKESSSDPEFNIEMEPINLTPKYIPYEFMSPDFASPANLQEKEKDQYD